MKNDKGPCKDKRCLHGAMKHVGGPCIMHGCPCEALKS